MNIWFGRAAVILAALGLAATSPLRAGERLTMRVSPTVAMAPATLVITTKAEPDASNRVLQIQVESEGYYRSSLMQVDGEEAAASRTVHYDGVPGGTYEIRATLFGPGGKMRAEAIRRVQIVSTQTEGGDPR